MKFSQTLALNANPDWEGKYLDYANLKKVINELFAISQQNSPQNHQQERQPREVFLGKLEPMMESIRDFYYEKRQEMDEQMYHLTHKLERKASDSTLATFVDDDELTPLNDDIALGVLNPHLLSEVELDEIRREICQLYVDYHNLQLYATMNATAVSKILKKYDKTMNDTLKKSLLGDLLSTWFPFITTKHSQLDLASLETNHDAQKLDTCMTKLTRYFSKLFCQGDNELATKRMKLLLREYVTFQRHSVWLDVIEDGRRRDVMVTGDAPDRPTKASLKQTPVTKPRETLKALLASPTTQFGIFSFSLFFILLLAPGIFDSDPVKRNALASFVLVSMLWAGEVMPLFVTSMLIPFLAVTLRTVRDSDGERLDAEDTASFVFASMFSHVIMLLLGGFSIAAALSKHNIAKMVATYITGQCGSGIRTVLLVNQFLATIASMWISNVAAPVLCYSLITPILKAATAEQSRVAFGGSQWDSADRDHRLCRALVMGIALASNVGGLSSPISSPQNLFALQYAPMGWGQWFLVSLPLCCVLNVVIWLWLVFCFQLPSADSLAVSWALQRERSGAPEKFSLEQYFVVGVSVGTVLLWCASSEMTSIIGDMGVLGIIPFALFFGTGILSKEDLNQFLWSVVVLAMGGLVLGKVISTSGLLEVVAEAIADVIEDNDLTLWATMIIFTGLILVCTTFISHTVGAIVILPICDAVGSHMAPLGHSPELVFSGAIACSIAMGLPVSGFPNMTAVSVEDNLGNRFLNTSDFLKIALPASIMSWLIVISLGYVLILQSVHLG